MLLLRTILIAKRSLKGREFSVLEFDGLGDKSGLQ